MPFALGIKKSRLVMTRASGKSHDPPTGGEDPAGDSAATPRLAIVGGEMVIVASIIGALFGFLFPAVELAREVNGRGALFPELMWLHQRTFPLPIIACSAAFALLMCLGFGMLRFLAPRGAIRYLPWWQKRRRTGSEANH